MAILAVAEGRVNPRAEGLREIAPAPMALQLKRAVQALKRNTQSMHEFTSGRLLNVLPPVLAGGILLATVWFHLRPAPFEPNLSESPSLEAANSPLVPAAINLSEMAGWALFGAVDAPSEVALPEPGGALEDLPPASIDLKLSGIAYSLDTARGFAILGTPDGQQREYRVGEVLLEGVSVHAIRPLEVVISNQGKLESVALPLESAPGGGLSPNRGYPTPGLPHFQGPPPGVNPMPFEEPVPMPTMPNQ